LKSNVKGEKKNREHTKIHICSNSTNPTPTS